MFKRNIRKSVLILSVFSTIALFFSGCGDNGGKKSESDSTKVSEQPTKTEHPDHPKADKAEHPKAKKSEHPEHPE